MKKLFPGVKTIKKAAGIAACSVLLLLQQGPASAQLCDHLQPVHGQDASEIYYAVDFVDVNSGMTVGTAGRIAGTTNGGTTWTTRNSGTREHLYDLHMLTGQLAYAVGANGTFLKTIDGGNNWIRIPNFTTNTLRTVHFTHADTGFVAGENGTIFRTTNGGASWTSVSAGVSATARLIDMAFPSSTVGYIVSNQGLLLKTTNGGLNWTSTGPTNTNSYTSVYALSPTYIVMGRDDTNVLAYSSDGGSTLGTEYLNVLGARVYKMHLHSASIGFAIGNNRVYSRSNGTWSVISTGLGSLFDLDFPNVSTGYAVGYGTIYKSNDSGRNWTLQNPAQEFFYKAVHFPDRNTGYLAGSNGKLYTTTNGGQTFTTATLPTTADLQSVHFTSATTGFAATNTAILRTTDGGATWTSQTIPGNSTTVVSDFTFTSATTGYLGIRSSGSGRVLKTTDGGSTWTLLSQVFMNNPEDITFLSPDTGFVANTTTFSSSIHRTTDAGATWTTVQTNTSNPIRSIAFANSSTGVAVEGNSSTSRAWRTTDGGITWQLMTFPPAQANFDLRNIVSTGANTLLITGAQGLVLKSADAGAIWTQLEQITSQPLDKAVVADDTTTFIISNQAPLLVKHTLRPAPATPAITQNGLVLSSSADYENQWFLNGTAITGATGQSLWVQQDGSYTVQVKRNGCTSPMSAPVVVSMPTGMAEDAAAAGFELYPNPAQQYLTLVFSSEKQWQEVSLTDLQGRTVRSLRTGNQSQLTLDLEGLPAGLYVVSVRSGNTVVHRKVVHY